MDQHLLELPENVMPVMSTPRLILRNWIASDLQAFAEMNADAIVMRYFPRTLTEEESLALVLRIQNHYEENGFGLYAVENKSTGAFLGFTGLSKPAFTSFFTPCIEIGWRYRKEAWGKGFATEAAKACIEYGFETLKLDRIVSFTACLNLPSENVMKRIGMTRIGTFDHPKVDRQSPLCRHVLYQIENGK